MNIYINFSENERILIENYANTKNISIQDLIQEIVLEKIAYIKLLSNPTKCDKIIQKK